MTYVDLNMVRAGGVKHPREWRWCGYDELVGTRSRHTVLHEAARLITDNSEDTAPGHPVLISPTLIEAVVERGRALGLTKESI